MAPKTLACSDTSDILSRLEFIGLDEQDCDNLRKLKPVIERILPVGLDKFYDKIKKTPEVARFFSSEKQMSGAQRKQLDHWDSISSGKFDTDYTSRVNTVGSIHARIGLEPRWYIGGYSRLVEHLLREISKELWPTGGMFSKKTVTAEEFGDSISSLLKAVFLDMDLAISVYNEEAEKAKNKIQEAILSERKFVSDAFSKAMSAIVSKNLSYRITEEFPESDQQLKDDFNSVIHELATTIDQIGVSATQIHSGSGEIHKASSDLSRRTEQQAASVEETAAALEETTTAMKTSTESARDAVNLVATTKSNAEKSGEIVQQAIDAMGKIETSSEEIANIIGVIDDIAFQTNLLALNAGVEAARAGESGKGFAVVAQEVRELAQRSASAAKEITQLITTSGKEVKSGAELVNETGMALEKIVSEMAEIDDHVTSIVSAASEQSVGLQEINQSVINIDRSTQQNAAMAEQSTAASFTLSEEVSSIDKMLREFVTGMARTSTGPQVANAENTPQPSPVRTLTRKVANSFGGTTPADEGDAWKEF